MPTATPSISDLRPGQRLTGVVSSGAVKIISVEQLDEALVEIVFRDESGTIGQRTLVADDLTQLRVVRDQDAAPRLDGDTNDFRLVAEALRIKYAALYDPIVAVNSSDVDPLPHQIRAVYEELLPRVPLRFLLADDPGAGKTIMAGLYIKELILRSDCDRAIIVAPGGLVEQWRDELAQKFDLWFEIFDASLTEPGAPTQDNPFLRHPYVIVRMDQIARNEELLEQLRCVSWDVAIVDEAHRMSARYSAWEGEVKETKRFQLGKLLSETAHNFLLMTATPHAGKEEDFQLFMSLLDKDRFEGRFREGVHRTDTQGLMRRMVKENLLTFEGKPLFPERRAYTVSYELSSGERELYEEVSEYVRTEMGRAEELAGSGEGRRGNNVGFALKVLQRRLASSPEAIFRSLQRRKHRLETQLEQAIPTGIYQPEVVGDILAAEFDEVTTAEQAQFEQRIDELVGSASAARTVAELEHEIRVLSQLLEVARRVRAQDEDRKWVELRTIFDQQVLSAAGGDSPRKIIVFTEHRDTLWYLEQKISSLFGRANSVVSIHGGTSRDERKRIREQFTHDADTVVLLATDAAGEGLNLQRAHLMVNYDLPWNPNRIEQRFGRIHRIGQREVCHLWNLVAEDTREGAVFSRLLEKIESMKRAYSGNLFNVLGGDKAFDNHSLKDLLIRAIRYGDNEETKQRLDCIIDDSVSAGLDSVIAERALHQEMFDGLDLEEIRQRMEKIRERKLQPGFISAFFIPAFERLGGRIYRRERNRYEITRVPPRIFEGVHRGRSARPIADCYERVTFDTACIQHASGVDAALIAPGHPLLDVVIELTIADLQPVLSAGAIFVDRSDNQMATPTLLYTVEQRVELLESGRTVSRHFDYPMLAESGDMSVTAAPLYLDYDAPTVAEREKIREIITKDWFTENHEKTIKTWAYREGMQPRLNELKQRRAEEIERTRTQVSDRLKAEINHWDQEYNRLYALEREGIFGRVRAETAKQRAEELERRLARRMVELDQALKLCPVPAVIRGVALVVPETLLSQAAAVYARDTKEVERRAVVAVMAAERGLGRIPQEMPHNNPGFDIRSTDVTNAALFIEVKGRIAGSSTFKVTANEVNFARTQGERHLLALVEVHPDGPEFDQVRYIGGAFDHIDPANTTQAYDESWSAYWERGCAPSCLKQKEDL